MRIARCLLVLCVGSMMFAVLLTAPGCGSGAAKGTGPMMQDAAPPAPGAMTTADYNKARKKK